MDDEPTTGSVQLIVDYSDGCKKCFSNLPWKSDMSVADVLAAAKSTSIGLEFNVDENGEILSIDGVTPPKEPHFVCHWRILDKRERLPGRKAPVFFVRQLHPGEGGEYRSP